MSLNREDVQTILDDITFRTWSFFLGDDNGRMYLQIQFMDNDTITGKRELQKGRKWFLSPFMCKSEIVRTAHKAVRTAIEHEVDETFKYKGVRIYGPHISVDALVSVAKQIEVREPNQTIKV